MAITNERNQSDLRLQELKIVSDLMESLVSKDAKRRQIAALMIPSAFSSREMSQRILTVLADDSDASVRVAAITKLGDGTSSQARITLNAVHNDESRPDGERKLARDLAEKVSLNSNLPPNSALLFASFPGKLAYEDDSVKGGVFTYFLSKAFGGDGDLNGDGNITIGELSSYVESQMPRYYSEMQAGRVGSRGLVVSPITPKSEEGYKPFLELSGSPDLIVGELRGPAQTRHRALVVGVSEYTALNPIKYGASDAVRIADSFKKIGVETVVLLNPTRATLVSAINDSTNALGPMDSFSFYFSGHGWAVSGESILGPTDIQRGPDGLLRGFSVDELKEALRKSHAGSTFAFLDVCRNEISISR